MTPNSFCVHSEAKDLYDKSLYSKDDDVVKLYDTVLNYIRSACCKIPLEWDKSLYSDDEYNKFWKDRGFMKEEYKIYQEIMEQSDIKQTLNECSEFKNLDNYIFYNPGYFLGKMNEWGMLEFNPYIVVADTLKTSSNTNIKITSNPGFVPFQEKYKKTGGYSTYINQTFNVKVSGNYYHEGVDIPVEWKEGVLIKALINGQVVYSNDQNGWTYGRFIVIKANCKYKGFNIFYLLGHLDRNKKIVGVKDFVHPGQTVGYVGNTGHCKSGDVNMNGPGYEKQRATGMGRHLHLEVFKTKHNDFGYFIKDISEIKKDKKIEVASSNAPIVNPFNFEEAYIQGKQE